MLRALGIFVLVCLADGVLILAVNISEHRVAPLHGYVFDTTVMTIIAGMAAVFAGIVASSLGAEATWTAHATLLLPAGRLRTALKIFVIDLAAVSLAAPIGVVAFYLPMLTIYGWNGVMLGTPHALPVLLVAVLMISLYGLSTLLGMLLPRKPHWSVLLPIAMCVLFAMFNYRSYGTPSTVAMLIGSINPFFYYSQALYTITGQTHPIYGSAGSVLGAIVAMLLITVISLVLAAWRWTRIEA